MKEIGIREMKARSSEIVRTVAEEGAVYLVTKRGRPAAMLTPAALGAQGTAAARTDAWQRLLERADVLTEGAPRGKSAVRELSAARR